jgi:preprotein translocase subunit SecD
MRRYSFCFVAILILAVYLLRLNPAQDSNLTTKPDGDAKAVILQNTRIHHEDRVLLRAKLASNSHELAPVQGDGGTPEDGSCPDGSFPVGQDGTPEGEPFHTIMTGAGIDDAAAVADQFGTGWVVNFVLTEDGSEVFGNHTATHIAQPLAIVIDGVVISAPVINAEIRGSAVIQSTFTEEEARALAVQLRSGALPVALDVVSVETIEPTMSVTEMLIYAFISSWIDPLHLGIFGDINGDGLIDEYTQFLDLIRLNTQRSTRIVVQPQHDSSETGGLELARDIVEQRVRGLGITNVVVQVQDNDHIVVALPTTADQDVVLPAVMKIGMLEFVDFANLPVTVRQLVMAEGTCIKTDEQMRIQEEPETLTQ